MFDWLQRYPLDTFSLALVALAIEAATGYPQSIYRRIGHPVTWIGALLRTLETRLNRGPATARKIKGVAALALLLSAVVVPAVAIQIVCFKMALGAVVLAFLIATLPAQRSLYDHVKAVADALEAEGLDGGRRKVAMIVGRDPTVLDEAGVVRAAIESLAENFSDGIVAPTFWTAIAGLPGGLAYKAANTADSMIGHRNERYLHFGWAAARFDDVINLPASPLAALWLILAAALPTGAPLGAASWRNAARAVARDARNHRSPNAGWPEAAMAGALGLKLAGPRVYGGERIEDAYMGDGRREANVGDLRAALRLYVRACVVQCLILAVATGVVAAI